MFNDIENRMWDDDEGKCIDYKYEEKAIEYFLKKQKDELKELIEELSEDYEEKQYLHIIALFKILNNENTKEIIEKVLRAYEIEKYDYDAVIMVILANNIKEYYKENLEKINSFIMMNVYVVLDWLYEYNIESIIDIIIDSANWLIKNGNLTSKEKVFIASIGFVAIDYVNCYELPVKKREELFKEKIAFLWEMRDYVDVKECFSSLFCGVIKKHMDILEDDNKIKYLTKIGIPKKVAKELIEMYRNYDNTSF